MGVLIDDPTAVAQSLWNGTFKTPQTSDVSDLLSRMHEGAFAQESGGNYRSKPNPRTGAEGGFQVLPENIGPWTEKHFGQRLTPAQFRNNAQAQEAVFSGEMGDYLKRAKAANPNDDDDTIIRKGAAMWYGGPGAMRRYDDPIRFRANEPSFREYTTSVLNKSTPAFDAHSVASSIWNTPDPHAVARDLWATQDIPTEPSEDDADKLEQQTAGLRKIGEAAKAGKPYVEPESADTIQAQVDSIRTPGSQRYGVLPTSDDQAGILANDPALQPFTMQDGRTIWIDEQKASKGLRLKTKAQIQTFLDKNPNALLRMLGTPSATDVGDDTGNNQPVISTTIMKNGLPIEGTSTVVTKPGEIKKVVQDQQSQFPQGQTQLTTTNAVVRKRQVDQTKAQYQAYKNSMAIKGQPAMSYEEFVKNPPEQNPQTDVQEMGDEQPIQRGPQGRQTEGVVQVDPKWSDEEKVRYALNKTLVGRDTPTGPITPEDVERWIEQTKARLPQDPDALVKGDRSQTAFAVNPDVLDQIWEMKKKTPEQLAEEAKQRAIAPLSDDALRAQAVKELTAELEGQRQAQQTDRRFGADVPVETQTPVPSEDAIQQRMAELKAQELSPEAKSRAYDVAQKNEGIPGAALSGFYGGAGSTMHTVAGVLRPFQGIIPGYQTLSETGKEMQAVSGYRNQGQGAKNTGETIAEGAGELFPQLAELTVLPGGPVAKFAFLGGAKAAGAGQSISNITKATTEGALTGGLFRGAEELKNPLARLGTVLGGSMTVNAAMGVPLDQNIQKSLVNTAFELQNVVGPKALGKVYRFWTGGEPYDLHVTPKGEVDLLPTKPEARVDGEVVIDPENKAYEGSTVKGTSTQTLEPIHEKAAEILKPVNDVAADETKKKILQVGRKAQEPAKDNLGAEPPVPEGTVRLYHGGTKYDGGPRWLTPDKDYAQGYANKSEGGQVSYVDVPKDSPLLKKAYDDEGLNTPAPYVAFEAPEEIAKELRPLNPEPQTVSHPNEQINGREIVARTDTGKVIVPNEGNKSGISVVTDRSESNADVPAPVEAAGQDVAQSDDADAYHNDRPVKVVDEMGAKARVTYLNGPRETSIILKNQLVPKEDFERAFVEDNNKKGLPVRADLQEKYGNRKASGNGQEAGVNDTGKRGGVPSSGGNGEAPANAGGEKTASTPDVATNGQERGNRASDTVEPTGQNEKGNVGAESQRPASVGATVESGGVKGEGEPPVEQPKPPTSVAEDASIINRLRDRTDPWHRYARKFDALSKEGKAKFIENIKAGDDPDVAVKDAKEWQDVEGGFKDGRGGSAGDAYSMSDEHYEAMSDNPNVRMQMTELPEKGLEKSRVSSTDVIKSYENVLDAVGKPTPIRTGRGNFAQMKASGFYKPHDEVIRLRSANNIPTASHEVGHGVQKYVYGAVKASDLKTLPWPVRKELVKLGKDLYGDRRPNAGYASEGWAEFMRHYLTTEDAQKVAPELTKWFEKEILSKHPKLDKALGNARKVTDAYRFEGAENRAKANTAKSGTFAEKYATIRRAMGSVSTEMIDEFTPLLNLSKDVKARGADLKASEDPFQVASFLRGSAPGVAHEFVTDHTLDFARNPVGKSLNDVLAPVKGRKEDFTNYLIARRAQELLAEGINPGMTKADADAIVRMYGTPEFQLAAQGVYDWNKDVLNYVRQASPEFESVVDKVLAKNWQNYVPLNRAFDEFDTAALRRVGGQGSPMKRIKGSGRRIKDVIPQMISNTQRMISLAHRQRVLDTIVNLSKYEGMGHLIEEVPRDKVPQSVQVDQIRKQLEGMGADLSNVDLDKAVTFFTPTQFPKGQDPIVPIMRGGKMNWYQVNEQLYNTLAGVDMYQLPKVLDIAFGMPARAFRLGTTGLRPAFSLIKNPTRDIQTFAMQSKESNPFKLTANYFTALAEALNPKRLIGERNRDLDLYHRLSVNLSTPLGADTAVTRRAAKEAFQGPVRRVVMHPIEALRELLSVSESVPRTAEIRNVASQIGWDGKSPLTFDQAVQMGLAAKQVTVDFTAAGRAGKKINQMIPFFNAAIQGQRQFTRAFRDHPARTIAYGLSSITAPTLALWWYNKDKEWYKDMPEREKGMYWNIESPDGSKIIQIPRAFEPGVLFGTMPETFLNAAYEKDPKAVKDSLGYMFDASTPNFLPQPAEVAKEEWKNRIDFFDSPIVSKSEEDKLPGEQYSQGTTELAKTLGRYFPNSVSPKRVDHIIRGLGGGASIDVIRAVEGITGLRTKGQTDTADTPVLGSLIRRGGTAGFNSETIDRFYDEYGNLQRLSRSSDKTLKEQGKAFGEAQNVAKALKELRDMNAKDDNANSRSARTLLMRQIAAKFLQKQSVRSPVTYDPARAQYLQQSLSK